MITLLRCRAVAALAVTAMLVAAPVAAQQTIVVQAGVTLERDTVTVGEVVKLIVRVRAPRGAIISFPTAVDSVGPIQAIEAPLVREGSDSANAADRVAVYRLSAWDIGKQPIKLGEVLVQTDDGDRHIALDLPTIFVKSVLPKDTALHVPKPARPLIDTVVPTPWWWWVLGAAALLAVILALWRWIERRRAAGHGPQDPYAEARVAFARVEKLKLIEAGEPGRHAALMVDVLRRYLSAKLSGVSLALTSQELLGAIRGTPTVTQERLRKLLDAVDPVKFARAPITPEVARSLGEDAKAIVGDEHDRAEALAAAEPKERAA